MTPPPAPPRPRTLLALAAIALPVLGLAIAVWRQGQALDELRQAVAGVSATLGKVHGEVTRQRIEQSAGVKGPKGLLEKLRTYAPLVASSRTTEPDYRAALQEIEAVMLAFQSLGSDAWKPIQERLAQLKPERDFDEIKQLLRASVAVDRPAGIAMLKEILLGYRLPNPRLRWFAATELLELDRPLAQVLLRQVLRTESARGFQEAHAAAFPGAVAPDRAAIANTGFFNFVVHYVRSEDPELEDTLLMVLGRVEHDLTTIQECVKALGARRCQRAAPVIEQLYTSPPLQQENPMFLNHCLTALVEIQGKAARPFLEQALPKASSEVVQKHIQFLLNKLS